MALSFASVKDILKEISVKYAENRQSEIMDVSSINLPAKITIIVNGNGNIYAELLDDAGNKVPVNASAAVQNAVFALPAFATFTKTTRTTEGGNTKTCIAAAKGKNIVIPSNGLKVTMQETADGAIVTLGKVGTNADVIVVDKPLFA